MRQIMFTLLGVRCSIQIESNDNSKVIEIRKYLAALGVIEAPLFLVKVKDQWIETDDFKLFCQSPERFELK